MKVFKSVLVICIVFLISGCISVGSRKLLLKQDVSFEQYDKIKHIVIEEAASNGYSKLMSEVKPSEYNNWKGELYFKTETIYGTDQLTVEFNKVGEGISVYIHGAGIRGNAESATKAILGRLDKEGLYKAAESETSDKKSQPTTVRPSPPPTAIKLKATTSEKSDRIYLITLKNSNIRVAPNTKSQISTTIKKGTKLEKISESADWFKVKLPSGETGYVYKPLTEEIQSPEASTYDKLEPPQATEKATAPIYKPLTEEIQSPEASTYDKLESPKATEKATAPKLPIPPDCPLAKIKEGMGHQQVMDILGPPKDQEVYTTGKQWIPFYFGPDVVRTVYYYKGLGQIHFSAGRVLEIMYDPKEDGYR